MTARLLWLSLLCLTPATRAALDADHEKLIADTPCLAEFRDWVHTGRAPERFEVPAGLTRPQCDHAVTMNDRIYAEQAQREVQARIAAEARKREEEERRAADDRRREAEMARLTRKIEADHQREMARLRALAAKPPARIGMTTQQVRDETRWGPPDKVRTTETAAGVRLTWLYGAGRWLVFEGDRLVLIQQ